jgi:DNA-binding transcriptional MocR family regulator
MPEPYDPLASVQAAGPPGTISFVYGLPDPAAFPAEELQRVAVRVLQEQAAVALQYGPEQGYGPLIDCIRTKIEREENLHVERPQMMLTAGSAPALDLFCSLFTKPGDRVLVEAPTYHDSIHLFRDHELTVHQVPMDAGGLSAQALAHVLTSMSRHGDRARFLYTIPNFQNPSGITLAAERRRAVLRLAERFDLLVVEDDVYRDLTYAEAPPPSLFELNGGDRVLRIGSFSKILAPGLRMGWLIAAPALIERLIGCGLLNMGGGANPFIANVLAGFCRQGSLEPHIARLRQTYSERRDVALHALSSHMPEGVRWTRPGGGFFIWLTLPPPLRALDVAARARKVGLWIPAGDPFFAEAPTGQHLRLAFSYVEPDKIAQGVQLLGEVLKSTLHGSSE